MAFLGKKKVTSAPAPEPFFKGENYEEPARFSTDPQGKTTAISTGNMPSIAPSPSFGSMAAAKQAQYNEANKPMESISPTIRSPGLIPKNIPPKILLPAKAPPRPVLQKTLGPQPPGNAFGLDKQMQQQRLQQSIQQSIQQRERDISGQAATPVGRIEPTFRKPTMPAQPMSYFNEPGMAIEENRLKSIGQNFNQDFGGNDIAQRRRMTLMNRGL